MRLYASPKLTGDINYLADRGFDGQINDSTFNFLQYLGIPGAYNDKLKKWKTEFNEYNQYILDGYADGGSVAPVFIFDPENGMIADRELHQMDYVQEGYTPVFVFDPENDMIGDSNGQYLS